MAKRSKSLKTNSAGRTIKSFRGSKRTLPIKDPIQRGKFLGWFDRRFKAAKSPKKKELADRDRMIIYTAINTAFRSEDVLQLRVSDVIDGHMSIKENKTGKFQSFDLNDSIFRMLKDYVRRYGLANNDYLFQPQQTMSRKRGVGKSEFYPYPVTRNRVNQVINEATDAVGINYSVGMHGLRKTFGYVYIKEFGGNPFTLQKMYNHSNLATTERYVMWATEDAEEARMKMSIGFVTPHKGKRR